MHGRHSEFIGKVMTSRLVILIGFPVLTSTEDPKWVDSYQFVPICTNLYQHYGAT